MSSSRHAAVLVPNDERRGVDRQHARMREGRNEAMALRILVVEDDEKIGDGLVEVFTREGYDTSLARTGEDGYFRLTTERFDLVVLDLGLPGRDGMEILKAVRKLDRDSFVLILSSRDEVDARVDGLTAGADDYLVKPFAMAELLARVQTLLRRGRNDTVLRLKVKDLNLDLVSRRVERNGRRIELTGREFDLLEYLMRHAHESVSREMLSRDVWKTIERATPIDNVIDVHIGRLRRKVDATGVVPLIHTVRGIGFCLSEHEPR